MKDEPDVLLRIEADLYEVVPRAECSALADRRVYLSVGEFGRAVSVRPQHEALASVVLLLMSSGGNEFLDGAQDRCEVFREVAGREVGLESLPCRIRCLRRLRRG